MSPRKRSASKPPTRPHAETLLASPQAATSQPSGEIQRAGSVEKSPIDEPSPPVIATSAADFVPDRPERIDRTLLPAYFVLLGGYSFAVSRLTGTAWYTMILFYVCFMLAFFVWHWQAHNRVKWIPFNKGCTEYHRIHHWEHFPPQNFYGTAAAHEAYHGKTAESMSSWLGALPLASSPSHEAFIYMLFIGIVVFARCVVGVDWATVGCAGALAVVIGVVGNYLHTSFHVQDHWLARYAWWRELRVVHFVHHMGSARHNYAMANFFLDKAFRTYHGDAEGLAQKREDKRIRALVAAAVRPGASESAVAAAATALGLPSGVSILEIRSALRTSPLAYALLMGSDAQSASAAASAAAAAVASSTARTAFSRGWSAVFVRAVLVAVALAAFFQLQRDVASVNAKFLAAGGVSTDAAASVGMLDRGHAVTEWLYRQLAASPQLAAAAVLASTVITEVCAAGAILAAVAGSSVRPALTALGLLLARVGCHLLVHLPACAESLWGRAPSLSTALGSADLARFLVPEWFRLAVGTAPDTLPTSISAYGARHQQFYAGSVALAVVVASELIATTHRHAPNMRGGRWWVVAAGALGGATVLAQVILGLATRGHWTVDIVAALVIGRYCHVTAARAAPFVDRFLP